MANYPKRLRGRQSLAGLTEIIANASKGLDAASYVLEDPAFSAVATRVVTLHELEQKTPTKGKPAPAKVPGIGLSRFVKPLDYYIAYRRRPWVSYVAVAAILAVPYFLGRASRRRAS